MSQPITLITGASSGIGLHLAAEFASHGDSLVIVAPNPAELDSVAADLRGKYSVQVHPIAKDLEQPDSGTQIAEELAEKGLHVETLVNNAGHGFRGRSWEIEIEKDLSMLRLNVEAVLRLTKIFLPPMVAAKKGRILNVASIAGFEPGPLLNVYHSTKAFVLSWSEGLAVELEGSGVVVTALCPGPTDTDFFGKADAENIRALQQSYVMSPQAVAKAGYEALAAGKLFVVPGLPNKALVMARRLLSEEAQAKLNQKFYEEVDPEDATKQRGDWEEQAGSPKPDNKS